MISEIFLHFSRYQLILTLIFAFVQSISYPNHNSYIIALCIKDHCNSQRTFLCLMKNFSLKKSNMNFCVLQITIVSRT